MICECKALGTAPPAYKFCPFCGARLLVTGGIEPVDLSKVLALKRPLGTFDLETTGTDVQKARIVSISITSHHADKDPIRWKSLVNPGIPIPKEASDVHGITDEMVQNAPSWKELATVLAPRMIDADLHGYNAKRYDVEVFRNECNRVGVQWPWKGAVLDPLVLWRLKRPMTLSEAFEEFTGRKLEGAHDASIDVGAVDMVLAGMYERWPDLPRTVEELSALMFPVDPNAVDAEGKFRWSPEGVALVAFGKHEGRPLGESIKKDRGYFEWLLKQSFPPDAKQIIIGAMKGVLPVRG